MSLALGVSADPQKLSISADGDTHSLGTDYGFGLIIPEVAEGEPPPPHKERELDPQAAPGWPVHFRTAAGQSIVIDLPVKTGASISGTVYEQEKALPGQQGESHLMAGAIIELIGADSSKYRISNSAGRFLFTGLTPGAYQVLIRTERLAEFYVADPAQLELNVAEGEQITGLTFTVRQAERMLEITEF
jgi:hypothetical protein